MLLMFLSPRGHVPILRGEGRRPREHVVHQRPEAPPVHRLAVARPRQDLGRHVLDGAAEGVGHRALVDGLLAQPEVGELHVALGVQQNVLRLKISVDNSLKQT